MDIELVPVSIALALAYLAHSNRPLRVHDDYTRETREAINLSAASADSSIFTDFFDLDSRL